MKTVQGELKREHEHPAGGDAAVRVVAPVSIEAAIAARVVGELDRRADGGQWVTRPIHFEGDLEPRIHGLVSIRGDAEQRITANVTRSSDGRQWVVRPKCGLPTPGKPSRWCWRRLSTVGGGGTRVGTGLPPTRPRQGGAGRGEPADGIRRAHPRKPPHPGLKERFACPSD